MMEYVELKGGMKVSRFALGTWGFSGMALWGPNGEEESIRTIRLAVEMGVNFLDTATLYGDGHSEVVLGKAIKGMRDRVLVATKVSADNLAYDNVIRECERSLGRLGIDCIDLYQIHWPNRDIPFDETRRAFDKLKQDGKIANMGVCNFGVKCLEMSKGAGIVTNQLPYNLLWRQVEDGIVAASQADGVSVWPYCPLAQGLLTGKFRTVADVPLARRQTRYYSSEWKQGRHTDAGYEGEIFGFLDQLRTLSGVSGYSIGAMALQFLKSRPGVGSVLIGARSEAQLRDNLAMFETEIPGDVMAEVMKLSDGLKPRMGTNPDMWQSAGRIY